MSGNVPDFYKARLWCTFRVTSGFSSRCTQRGYPEIFRQPNVAPSPLESHRDGVLPTRVAACRCGTALLEMSSARNRGACSMKFATLTHHFSEIGWLHDFPRTGETVVSCGTMNFPTERPLKLFQARLLAGFARNRLTNRCWRVSSFWQEVPVIVNQGSVRCSVVIRRAHVKHSRFR